jgi:putative transposase
VKKRVFSREFKLDIVRQLISGEKRLAQLCREHHLCETLVRRWREQYEARGEHAWQTGNASASALADEDPQARIRVLEAALVRATLENEFLRHALQTLRKGGTLPPKNGR